MRFEDYKRYPTAIVFLNGEDITRDCFEAIGSTPFEQGSAYCYGKDIQHAVIHCEECGRVRTIHQRGDITIVMGKRA